MSHYLSYILKSKTIFWDIITGKKVNLYAPIPDTFQILKSNQPKWWKAFISLLSHSPIVSHIEIMQHELETKLNAQCANLPKLMDWRLFCLLSRPSYIYYY